MPFYEYKVVPAPEKAPRVKGLKGTPRFAHALQEVMNDHAQDGWEYQRAETLPDEERKGLMGGRETVMRTVLVFRRELFFEDHAEDVESEAQGPASTTPAGPRDVVHFDAPAVEETRAEAGIHSPHGRVDLTAEPETWPVRRPLVAERTGRDHDT